MPAGGVARPAGAKITITPNLIRVLAAVGSRLQAKFILGLNLEANNIVVARDEALGFLSTIGPAHIGTLEIGNEPELYDVLGWYASKGRPVQGRPPGYSIRDYTREFAAYARPMAVRAVNGLYVVRVPSPSAALLTLSPRRPNR